jgi:cell filamentation protein
LSISHYFAIHRHLFQDVYSWAGKPRVVRISRGQSMFCYPERIRPEMKRIFAELRSNELLRRLGNEEFSSKAAHVLAEINAVHPFRDGNGRAQLAFLAALAHRAGFDLKLERLRPKQFLAAMIRSFQGREDDLEAQIASLIK